MAVAVTAMAEARPSHLAPCLFSPLSFAHRIYVTSSLSRTFLLPSTQTAIPHTELQKCKLHRPKPAAHSLSESRSAFACTIAMLKSLYPSNSFPVHQPMKPPSQQRPSSGMHPKALPSSTHAP
ncbi:hypothetical protein K437DRAFT_29769 [Tilletiaria anomala UBC 951]|uniref:Uncharacterized protein n=1 Tax=Tilletiaria anomala (strain ATCC 24038 / CBS 436.72 / UBC 951) TaxID=1037660 RepID=A0A066V8L7_TILAU|nr:uncharacterized protein K437DRAFT_29769 [Tilletiaria anomala UBC 951]KDN38087.1 hypothetical protein K437DRAFT_29769 [Tilletiaria anomala UBC 951]